MENKQEMKERYIARALSMAMGADEDKVYQQASEKFEKEYENTHPKK